MYILGFSAYYHDSAACLIKDGKIIAASQEERFTRIKHDSTFPLNAIQYCIKEAKILPKDLDTIVFYEKPFLKFERLLETYLAFAPKGFRSFSLAMPLWIKEKLFQKYLIIKNLKKLIDKKIDWHSKLQFSEHHLSHAASAFYPSPFNDAAILTMDGVGEWATTSIATGDNNSITIIKEINFPHSLGLLYSAFTYYIGFKVNSGEYKIMGLAPYGKPKYLSLIKENLIDLKEDGSFKLDMSYFDYCTGLTMTNNKFHKLFKGSPRKKESKITQKDMDISASIQKLTEEIIIKMSKEIKNITNKENLCLAGGVALNCVANSALLKENIFKNIWVQPASGDAGGAIGAALSSYYILTNKNRSSDGENDGMQGGYLGPSYSNQECEKVLNKIGAKYKIYNQSDIIEKLANNLAEGKAIGLMNGRMEFGPRSLGARSIIADPRSPSMQKQLNLKVKYRESFRPFAPSILKEDLNNWFQLNIDSPYMLFIAKVLKEKRLKPIEDEDKLFGIDKLKSLRSQIPAVTHVDYSSRIHTVDRLTNPFFYSLIKRFKEITGVPILVNTSFNVRGEPIVCSPEDAFKCFMGTELDILVIGNIFLNKFDQLENLKENYKNKYELD